MTTITTDPRGMGPDVPARRPYLAALMRGRPGEPRWARPRTRAARCGRRAGTSGPMPRGSVVIVVIDGVHSI